jgi:hypothetical protein
LERRDFLEIPGIGEAEADRLLELIDELTVVEGEPGTGEEEGAEESEDAADDLEEDATVDDTDADEDGRDDA